ncbi:Rieske 2Fe-2S domain-containing protein [Alkalihalobacillus sp. LMS39]|uniref:Rieske (2Fe-2S) protein n=1 Tax=Alkalihalobacillus sp. LMS39 TaxID=2924032 RepID=UPI001FB3DA0D|nr:Rieske 2Fe-2S domain-containing protein [Alkalihalobacillus sp. LMS39]UOE92043.1 Rieske 2Fe-2S domain-containing protein [Alkalihalobacillus sp. LMS39]
MNHLVLVGTVEEIKTQKAKIVKGGKHGIAVLFHDDQFYAVDNRCPHLGFPLHVGSMCDGILTCHWHHARFDLKSGGTLDPWADDATTYPVEVKENNVFISLIPKQKQTLATLHERLRAGLEQNLSLVIAKAVVGLVEAGASLTSIAQIGVEFGTTHRKAGWRSGLTILTAMTNVLPFLDKNGKILALYQGLVHVARECSGAGTKFLLKELPVQANEQLDIKQLAKWYRESVEVRDPDGAERVLLTAINGNASTEQLSDMMMTAITDHYYMNVGHTLDFHNKAFEILHQIDHSLQPQVLASLLPELRQATRSEELQSWKSPINLVTPLEKAFEKLPDILSKKVKKEGTRDENELVDILLGDDPIETIHVMVECLQGGLSPTRLAKLVTVAASERIARFHVQNEFPDWITVLHTFTHAHAVHESLQRSETPELTRAVFHSAMSIYLDRFLNVPTAKKPKPVSNPKPEKVEALLQLLDKHQQTDAAGKWVVQYLQNGGDKKVLFETLGHALLREDAEFHSFQMFEAALREHENWNGENSSIATRAQETMILAMTRYIAAHAPTARELPHTASIAMRLHRGEKLFEE